MREFLARFRALWNRQKSEADLADELHEHLGLIELENIRRGMSPEEARFAARRAFGGVEQMKEIYRDRRGLPMLESFLQDLRFGARMLRKNPGFTVIAILTLALGIGANSAIFSVTNAALGRALAVKNPNEVVIVTTQTPKEGPAQAFSVPLFRDLQRLNAATLDIAAYTDARVLLNDSSQSERATAELVSDNYFSTLGIQPVIGSAFSSGDDRPGAAHLAVISYSLWRRMFSASPDVLGKKLSIDSLPFVIIGVAPRDYTGFIRGESVDIWMTLPGTNPDAAADLVNPGDGWLVMFGRLARGVSLKQAQDRMTSLLPAGYENNHDTNHWTASLTPAGTGNDRLVTILSRPLQFLALATGLVLLIACANVANLLLSRGTSRRREIAVRLALGASRSRITRQLFTESAMLAAAGAALGLAIAWSAGRAVEGLRTPVGIALSLRAGLDLRVLFFTLACTILSALVFGIAPARTASRSDINAVLKDSPESTGRRRWLSGRSLLVVAQVAFSFALVVTASLFLRSLWNLQNINLGFSSESVLTMSVSLSGNSATDTIRGAQFYTNALEQLNALPGILSASFTDRLPITRGGTNLPRKPGDTIPSASAEVVMNRLTVSPGFFKTLNLPIVRGREFTSADSANAAPAIIVNESMAETFWPDTDPVGRLFVDGKSKFTVVGVARNTKYRDLREAQWLTIYRPLAQSVSSGAMLMVRTAGSPLAAAKIVRDRLLELDPTISILNVRTLPEHIGRSLDLDRLLTTLLVAFGALALGLACIGLFGVMAFQVAQRTREVGIRMALGANRARVLAMIMSRALTLTISGLVAGWLLSYWVTSFASSQLFEMQPNDPWTFAISATLLLLAATAASFLPARRATQINPLDALRQG